MADKKLTLLELNLGDGSIQIGPATLGDEAPSADTDAGESAGGDSDDDSSGCGCPGRKAGKLLLVLAVLGVVAFAAAKLLGGGEYEDLDELEDLSDLDEE
ncbi:hypothetical protein ACFR97_03110 [Haloplanus litoreus]|uniref:DUF4366 domain-containing protein n=1 Tax=Haloplanus litoreus TaxID=767515 RepID=A0ABD6A0K4_9EURY